MKRKEIWNKMCNKYGKWQWIIIVISSPIFIMAKVVEWFLYTLGYSLMQLGTLIGEIDRIFYKDN